MRIRANLMGSRAVDPGMIKGRIVVGALTIGPGAGGAYVFTQDGAGWHQIAALRPRTALPTSSFGFSVATSGQFAVVGDPGYGGGAGRTYVFGRAQKGWGQTSELTGRDTRPGDSFGYSVAISAGQILVSAPWHKAGEAYVFRLAHQNWRQTAGITGQPIGYDQFGYSVALDGTVAVVGAPGLNTGAAYLFDQVGGNWGPAAEIAAPSPADRFFGNAAAISGTAVLIAANGYNAAAGAVWAATVLNPPGRYAPPGTGRADKGARLWSATGQSQEPMTVGQPDRLHEVSLRAFMLSHPPGVY